MGLTWVGQNKDVKMFTSNCGICLRLRKKHYRPPMGKSLYRVKIDPKSFTHLSVDPLGVIKVKGAGTQTQRLYPIIMACLNSGGVHTEIMGGLEARDVYLALLRLQYRYNVRVTQLFSDHGSQISANLLGKKKDFYVKTLRGLWSVHNNVGHFPVL